MAHTGQLVELVLTWIGDPEGNRYPIGLIGQHLQEAQRTFLRETGTVLMDTATLASTNDSPAGAFYDLPTNLFEIVDIAVDGQPLLPKSEAELAGYYANWRTVTGTARFYVRYGNQIRIVPYTTADQEPECAYTKRPSDIMVTQGPDVDAVYHIALAHYAAGWVLVNDDNFADPTKAKFHRGEFDAAVESAKGPAARRQVRTYRASTIRRWR